MESESKDENFLWNGRTGLESIEFSIEIEWRHVSIGPSTTKSNI